MIHSLGATSGEAAELAVARAIDKQRPDWDIVHSRWYVHDAPRRHIEGEGDLIVVIPNLGFVVVEVKGAARFKVESGIWSRWESDRNQWVRFDKPPWRQAAETMHYFRKRFEKRLGMQHFGSAFAVAFPNADFSSQLNVEAGGRDHPIMDEDYLHYTIGGRQLAHIDEDLQSFLEHQARQRRCDTSKMLSCLLPTAEVLQPYPPSAMRQAAELRVRLTQEQCAAVSGVLENERVAIQGGPGTGKSVVGVDVAMREAQRAGSVLLLCFNRMLMEDLRSKLDGCPVEVNTLHSFAIKVVETYAAALPGRRRADFPTEEAWWAYCTTEGLGHAVDRGLIAQRGLIIIDEYQDLNEHQSAVARTLPAVRKVLLCDPNQNLFGDDGAGQVNLDGFIKYQLPHNIRSSRELALCVRELGPKVIQREQLGTSPVVYRWPSLTQCVPNADLQASIRMALQEWKSWGVARSRTVILSATREMVDRSVRILNALHVPAVKEIDPWRRNQGVLVSTIRAFKGMDADAVALLSPPPIGSAAFNAADAYVAVSRACNDFRLFVEDPGEPRWFTEAVEKAKRSQPGEHQFNPE